MMDIKLVTTTLYTLNITDKASDLTIMGIKGRFSQLKSMVELLKNNPSTQQFPKVLKGTQETKHFVADHIFSDMLRYITLKSFNPFRDSDPDLNWCTILSPRMNKLKVSLFDKAFKYFICEYLFTIKPHY